MTALNIVIMAAGKGTRMQSTTPKVLHQIGGKGLLQRVLATANALQPTQVVVITGHDAEKVETAVQALPQPFAVRFARQMPQLGTGHALQQAAPLLQDDSLVLILSGDVPLIEVDTLQQLIAASQVAQMALLTIAMPNPTGYGRIIRSQAGDMQSNVQAIVEQKDATDAQRAVTEVYSGMMVLPAKYLKSWLSRLNNHNAQNEYYLTDIVKFAVADDVPVVGYCITDEAQVAGVNSQEQLAALERTYQLRQATALMRQGVRLMDPARFDLRGELHCGQNVEIDVNCIFEGKVVLADNVRIGANCVISNATIASAAVVHPFSHIEGGALGVSIGQAALVGPFARLRPGAKLGAQVHVGNFVEIKNTSLAAGAKANHLAYLGDATVGERVNFGAGSITANYDGNNKHRTIIEDDVHVGSNCVLVAPITLGRNGTVGGGSTLTKSTEANALSVARAKQASVANWTRPAKKKS